MKKGSIKDREYDRGHALLVNTDYPVQGKNISVFTVYFLNTPQLFSLLFSHWIGLLFFSYDKKNSFITCYELNPNKFGQLAGNKYSLATQESINQFC